MHAVSPFVSRFWECSECGLVYLDPRLPEDRAFELYPNSYAPYVNRGGSSLPRADIRIGRANQQFLADALSSVYQPVYRGCVLDFGCGSSQFLDTMRAAGWQRTVGADVVPAVLREVRAAGHVAVDVAAVEDEIPSRSVDVLRMNHVFEHLYSPREVLAILIPKLTARGWMHIAVPNPHGLTARLLRSYWIASEPRHVLLYPPQLLVDVLVEAGLSTVNVCFEVVTKDFTRSLRFAIGRAAGIVDSPSMQRPLWTVAALAASRRVADRYHVFASR